VQPGKCCGEYLYVLDNSLHISLVELNCGTLICLHARILWKCSSEKKFSKYINFDVFTSKKPRGVFKDESLPPQFADRCTCVSSNTPAFLFWLFVIIPCLRSHYDLYIITSPPESLLFLAYILQKINRKVLVDMRDPIDRPKKKFRLMIPVYRCLYKKIKNVVVAWRLIDETRPCVYHGYDIEKTEKKKLGDYYYYSGRISYILYVDLLKRGLIPKYKDKGINIHQTWHTLLNLNIEPNIVLHPECYTIKPKAWKDRANEIKKIIQNIS